MLVSYATAELVKEDLIVRTLGKIRVVGRKQAVGICEILMEAGEAVPEAVMTAKREYEAALIDACTRSPAQAIERLEAYVGGARSDEPACRLLSLLRKLPADQPWDGIWVQDEK